jgi:hypothetical protein
MLAAGVALCVVWGRLTLDDGHDGALLDGRRALETVGVDTAEELSLQVHVVEGVGGLIVVGLDLACTVSVCARSICLAFALHSHCVDRRIWVRTSPQRSQRKSFICTHPQARPQDPCQP